MPDNKATSGRNRQKKSSGLALAGLFAATLLLMIALSALALKLFAPDPTVAPEVIEQAAVSTMQIAVPIYVDETVNALLPGIVSGTLTASVPTATPIPPTPTPPSTPCDLAGFISDQTIPDGTQLKASTPFTKVWAVRNLGTCTWAEDYSLVFSSGELMAGQSPLTIGRELAPGDTLEFSINLVSPATGGMYSSNWMLHNSSGEAFGLSPNNQPLSFHVSVGSHKSVALDFTDQICFATWSSATGDMECPNPDDFINGSVNPVENTLMEYGMEFTLPSIEVIPNEGMGGRVNGIYDLLQIQKGDIFRAIVGCADGQPECELTFELQYDPGDHVPITLGSWSEKTDGAFQKVSVDLSPLEGKTIRLILLTSSVNGSAIGNKGIWISPVIFRVVE